MDARRLTARIEGRVQGVGYRYYTEARAGALALTGWVRNEPDGSVLVVAEGPERSLRDLVAALEAGPPGGRVDRVETDWSGADGSFESFRIRR